MPLAPSDFAAGSPVLLNGPVAKRDIQLDETPMDRLECGALQAKRQMHLVSWHFLHQVKREPFVHSQNVKRAGSAFMLQRQDLLIERTDSA
jgi:hypothetical protein